MRIWPKVKCNCIWIISTCFRSAALPLWQDSFWSTLPKLRCLSLAIDDDATYLEEGVPEFLGGSFPFGLTGLKFTVNKDRYSRGLASDAVRLGGVEGEIGWEGMGGRRMVMRCKREERWGNGRRR
jgi:hypothetical protein